MSERTDPSNTTPGQAQLSAGGPHKVNSLFVSPERVARDPTATRDEKRARVASRLSDARTVPNAPAWRQNETGALARFDGTSKALAALDEPEPIYFGGQESSPHFLRRRQSTRLLESIVKRKRRTDDDDDLPPTPATPRLPPNGPPPLDAAASLFVELAA